MSYLSKRDLRNMLMSIALMTGLVIGGALIFKFGRFQPETEPSKKKEVLITPKEHIEDIDLQAYYDALNQEFYDNKLPEAIVRFTNKPYGQDENGNTVRAVGLSFPTEPKQIMIDDVMKDYPVVAYETLAHEQCHVYVDKFTPEFDEHGPKFQKCMLKLAEAGALAHLW
jgi:hypothetical protein